MLEEKLNVGTLVNKTTRKSRQKGAIENIFRLILENHIDVFLGPEWLFMNHKKIYSQKQKDRIINIFAKRSQGLKSIIIPGTIMWQDDTFLYNTAPLISNGELIGEYHKQTDGGTVYEAKIRNCDKSRYKNKNTEGGLFFWNGFRIGIEICSDHSNSILKEFLKTKNERNTDLHLVSSCGMNLCAGNLTTCDDGYGFISDGVGVEANAMQREYDIEKDYIHIRTDCNISHKKVSKELKVFNISLFKMA